MTNAERQVEALLAEVERLQGYKEREDQEGVHIHRCPRQGESVTPCCGKTPFEIPGWHRMTAKPELVNCGRLELEAENERLRGVVEATATENVELRLRLDLRRVAPAMGDLEMIVATKSTKVRSQAQTIHRLEAEVERLRAMVRFCGACGAKLKPISELEARGG